MSLFTRLRQARTALATAWLAWIRPRPTPRWLPRPEQITQQPLGSLWCGPAVAQTTIRLLAGREDDLMVARSMLLGTWKSDQTSVQALAAYLERRGLRTVVAPASLDSTYDLIRVALTGGAACIPLVQAAGRPGPVAHFILIYGIASAGELLVADSLPPGPLHAISERTFTSVWATTTNFYGDRCPVIVVRL